MNWRLGPEPGEGQHHAEYSRGRAKHRRRWTHDQREQRSGDPADQGEVHEPARAESLLDTWAEEEQAQHVEYEAPHAAGEGHGCDDRTRSHHDPPPVEG